jgi:uncharacterized membrane protein YheB (UPF0754 family)
MILRLLISGFIGGAIGYITNFIAIRMLFYPKKKTLGFQGLLARFKDSFAEKTADFIFQFLNYAEILEDLSKRRVLTSYVRKAEWGLLRKFAGLAIFGAIERGLGIKGIREDIASDLKGLTPKAKSLLARKIAESDYEILRKLILNNTTREVHFIQCLGGILGFLIGIIQPLVFR